MMVNARVGLLLKKRVILKYSTFLNIFAHYVLEEAVISAAMTLR